MLSVRNSEFFMKVKPGIEEMIIKFVKEDSSVALKPEIEKIIQGDGENIAV